MLPKALGQYRFYRLPSISSDDESSEFLDKQALYNSARNVECPACQRIYSPPRSYLWDAVPWVLSCMLAAMCLVLLLRLNTTIAGEFGTFEEGFVTDVVTRPIPLERVRFRGTPHFMANGTSWINPVDPKAPYPENLECFGTPSQELDDNWDSLIEDRYFLITEEEAERAWGDKRHEYVDPGTGGYIAGLDMFHTLHCVNAVRKALRRDHYLVTSIHGPDHTVHCLELLRQSIQCYGSTTLIPTRFMEGLGHLYRDSDQKHLPLV
ncbi:hypothetical protein MFIFM68171_07097 [Madurella fahalii]|uniref:Uncharacterized protein n=1 Tax=Madurella fahalii TaxID=1157608 RepID=A0ABQ0GGM1_9PEZI